MDHQLRLALVWNGTVLIERHFSRTSNPDITIGEALSNDLVIPAPDLPERTSFLTRTNRGYAIRPHKAFTGTLHLEDRDIDFETLDSRTTEVELKPGEWGTVGIGEHVIVFFQIFDEGDQVAGRGIANRFDPPVVGSVTASAALHIAFLMLAHLAFDVDPLLAPLPNDEREVEFAVYDPKDPIEPEIESEFEEATGKRAEGEDGAAGIEDEELAERAIKRKDGELTKVFDPSEVGVAHAIKTLGPGALKQMLEPNVGFDNAMRTATDGDGTLDEQRRGLGGMSIRGDKKGGGGQLR